MAVSILLPWQILLDKITTERFVFHGPGSIWARAHFCLGPFGPGPIWARALPCLYPSLLSPQILDYFCFSNTNHDKGQQRRASLGRGSYMQGALHIGGSGHAGTENLKAHIRRTADITSKQSPSKHLNHLRPGTPPHVSTQMRGSAQPVHEPINQSQVPGDS